MKEDPHLRVPVLMNFVASWAEAICTTHRAEVVAAADQVGPQVRVADVGECPELALAHNVLNVLAVAIEGAPEALVVGAVPAAELLERLGLT